MLEYNPLLQTIIVPIATAVIIGLLSSKIGKFGGILTCISLTYTSAILTIIFIDVWSNLNTVYEEYVWSEVLGLRFGFLADGLSLPVALVMNLVCTACAYYSIPYIMHRIEILYGGENYRLYNLYFAIYLLFAVGLTGVAFSTNLISMYIFLELVLIPSYFMIDLFGYYDRHRIAMMYFLWNHLGAGLFLAGVILAYFNNGGSFNIMDLAKVDGSSAFWICFFILIGWLIKMAVFGFHVWLPHAHGEHPTSIAAIIATIVGLGNYVIVRLLVSNLFNVFQIFGLPLMVWALITMVYGAFLTLAQDDVKRLYACSTISQNAYSILGIASCTILGVYGGVFYFISHMIGKCILFSVAGIIVYMTEIRDMNKLSGLAKIAPFTAILAILGSMILSAIPPLSGFQAEWIMFIGIFEKGIEIGIVVALIGIFATFLTLVYTFWPIKRIFFGSAYTEINLKKNPVKEPLLMVIPLYVLAITSLIFGIYPDLIMKLLENSTL
ncbi:MAG: proton-conducting transporter membrane subunit [Candidatus Caldarchaeales archaeon]